MNIDAQPPGNQHVSVWQQCGGVAVTRGVEAAGKREASGGSKGLDGRAPEQYGNAQARQYNRASHFVALNASATHRISMVLEWAKLFWAEQHGVLRAAYIGGVADDLAGVVDSDGVCKGEAGAGGNQRIEIDQATITVDERNVLAWLGRVVLSLRKVCSAHDLAVHIDSLRQVRISPGDRAQVRPDPIAVPGRVGRGAGAKVKGARDLTVVIDSEGANSRRTGGYRELRYLAVGVDEGTSSARYQKITAHYLARIMDGHSDVPVGAIPVRIQRRPGCGQPAVTLDGQQQFGHPAHGIFPVPPVRAGGHVPQPAAQFAAGRDRRQQ